MHKVAVNDNKKSVNFNKGEMEKTMLDKKEIEKIIPQRDPFLMIDEVEEYIPGESAIAYKNVREDEWYFKGHFPRKSYNAWGANY